MLRDSEIQETSMQIIQFLQVMESVDGNGTGNSPRALPVVTLGEAEGNHGRKSSSSLSSSSSSSSSGLVIGLEDDDVMQVETPEDVKDTQIDSDNMDDDFRDNSMPLNEPHSPDPSPTQSPPAQVMERPIDSPAYRIPSSVFARTKSSAPMEWSVTSNESLFSIQMGNMSFTRDHVNWLGKSGELTYQGDSNFPTPMNGPRIDMSSNQPTTPSKHKSAELGQKNNVGAVSFGLTETKAAETMREVIRENEDNHCKEKAQKTACNSPSLNRSSDASGASTKSFAFPILTGEEKSSRHTKSRGNSQPPTPKVAAQQTQADPQSQTQQLQTSKTENAPNKSQSFFECKWFSCFPCCRSCS